jgi:hypothetical protein
MGLNDIVSINTANHKPGDPQQKGEQHLREMKQLGVDGLQINLCYDRILFI